MVELLVAAVLLGVAGFIASEKLKPKKVKVPAKKKD